MIKTHQVKLYPNRTMTKVINDLFNYRRYIWNQALSIWNDMYDESIIMGNKKLQPNRFNVKKELTANKADWQYTMSSHILNLVSSDLEKAWKNFWNPNMPDNNKPKFKSKKNYKPTFTMDRARIVNGKLILEAGQGIKYYPIRISQQPRFSGELKQVIVTENADGIYASLVIDTPGETLLPTNSDIAGVDVNVKRFNYNEGVINIYPNYLEKHYSKINYYQRMLARKRVANPYNFKTKRYSKVKAKLRREYQKVTNIQNDILHKFTKELTDNYGEIHIEDLNIHGMMMSKRMGKNLHRSMFGRLSEVLSYKSTWYNRKLVLVDRLYPSTQICSECGFIKTKDTYGGKQTLHGDSIHHKHQTYYCYNCGAVLDRDENAVHNIINYG